MILSIGPLVYDAIGDIMYIVELNYFSVGIVVHVDALCNIDHERD